ncbi:hypothetical protein HK096_007419, partial [Nowakowskiella sp. JEL0078]
MFSTTRYTTCIPAEFGGSGNPSVPTARGVVRGLQAAFEFAGLNIVGSTIAVQGVYSYFSVGHVGTPLIEFLFDAGVKKIIASDVDKHRENEILKHFEGKQFELRIVEKSDMSVLFEEVDAVCPCATGAIINSTTIPKIKAKIVCGAANNQLQDIRKHDKELKERGIIYIPDFLVNRMGIVNCADEHMGAIDNDPKLEKHLGSDWDNSIYKLTHKVLSDAATLFKTTQEIALDLAEKKTHEINPLYGHRGKEIIAALQHSKDWQKKIRGDVAAKPNKQKNALWQQMASEQMATEQMASEQMASEQMATEQKKAPSGALEAVLVPSNVPASLSANVVRGYDFNNGIDYSALLKSYISTGFQATEFGKAVNEINRMLDWRLSDEDILPDETDEYKDPE